MPDLGITPWRLLVLCVGILLLRRIPAVLMLYKWVPEITNWKEALFCGHFGELILFLFQDFICVMFCLRTGEYSCPILRRYLIIIIINDANRWVLVPSSYQPLLYTAYLNRGIPLKRRKIFLHSLYIQW